MTIPRTIHLATSKLLAFHIGNAERDRIFADVTFSREKDTRKVWLTAGQIALFLASCEPWFRPFPLTAMATNADRSPLLRMRVRDVSIAYDEDNDYYSGVAHLDDTKTDARERGTSLIDAVCRALLPLLQGKGPDDFVFDGPPDPERAARGLRPIPLRASQVRYWFEVAREEAGLPKLRLKDLRRTWAVHADKAGLNLGEMKEGMGHKREETTVSYTNREVALDLDAARKVARSMGLERT